MQSRMKVFIGAATALVRRLLQGRGELAVCYPSSSMVANLRDVVELVEEFLMRPSAPLSCSVFRAGRVFHYIASMYLYLSLSSLLCFPPRLSSTATDLPKNTI